MSCSIEGCGKKAEKRGWCAMHYRRWRIHGDVNVNLRPELGKARDFINEVALTHDVDECLIWPFAKNNQGYAIYNGDLATRLICSEVNGAPPTIKHEAAHICGGGAKGCIARTHLVWKTRTENERDKILHGTSNRGERSAHAKLTNLQVKEMLPMLGKISDRRLGKIYGVSGSTISEIRNGKRWAWLTEEAA